MKLITIEELLREISAMDAAVQIQRLGRTTQIGDCSKDLWDFLGLTRDEVFPLSGRRLQILDIPHDVWMCKVGFKKTANKRVVAYGYSFREAVQKALFPNYK